MSVIAASNVGIALISAGAALLGALVGGWVTYRVEKSRQEAARELEQERYEREQTTREQQDLAVARGLARVLLNDLMNASTRLGTESEMNRWRRTNIWTPSLGADDRRDLFRYLSPLELEAVLRAETALEALNGLRQHFLAHEEGAVRPIVGPSNAADSFSKALEAMDRAEKALRRLAFAEPEPAAEQTG